LEASRRVIAGSGLTIAVVPAGDDVWNLTVSAAKPLKLPAGVEAKCFPISLARADGQTLTAGSACFEKLSLASLTGFVAVVLKAEKNGRRATAGFVVNLPVSASVKPIDHGQVGRLPW
jgi:hypothetical protein